MTATSHTFRTDTVAAGPRPLHRALRSGVMSFAALIAFGSIAATRPADVPAGSTALCRDGSYATGSARIGACKGHNGVKAWYGTDKSATTGAPARVPATGPVPAVQTQSAAVSATGQAPTTGVPTRTPGTPENPVTAPK